MSCSLLSSLCGGRINPLIQVLARLLLTLGRQAQSSSMRCGVVANGCGYWSGCGWVAAAVKRACKNKRGQRRGPYVFSQVSQPPLESLLTDKEKRSVGATWDMRELDLTPQRELHSKRLSARGIVPEARKTKRGSEGE